MIFGSPWTPERIVTLKALVDDKLSSGEIAKRLNLSRGAVIGRLARDGIKLHNAGRKVGNTSPRRPEGAVHVDRKAAETIKRAIAKAPAAVPVMEATEVVDLPTEIVPADQRKTLYELTEDTCRWPIGDPTHADFHFCGGHAPGERPYCPAHTRMAIETPAQRKARFAAWRTEQKARAAA